MENWQPLVSSLALVCIAIGAYLSHFAYCISEWVWPKKCESEVLAKEVRVLLERLGQGGNLSFVGEASRHREDFPYIAVAVWSLTIAVGVAL